MCTTLVDTLATSLSSQVEASAQHHSIEQDTEDSELKDYRRGSVDSRRRDSLASMVAPDETNDIGASAEKVLEGSALRSKMDTLLEEMYSPLERWYLRSSLEKVSQRSETTVMRLVDRKLILSSTRHYLPSPTGPSYRYSRSHGAPAYLVHPRRRLLPPSSHPDPYPLYSPPRVHLE